MWKVFSAIILVIAILGSSSADARGGRVVTIISPEPEILIAASASIQTEAYRRSLIRSAYKPKTACSAA